MDKETQPATRIEIVRHRRARVDHYFLPNNVVERYLVIEDKMLRIALRRPRRENIDSLDWPGGAATANNSDQWVFAKCAAEGLLRKLYEGFLPSEVERAAIVPEQEHKSGKRTLGRVVEPIVSTDDAAGTLVYAGIRPGIAFCIELFRSDGNVQRVEGIDLPRALEMAEAKIGDTICVSKVADHRVGVSATHSGTHGTGRRFRRRTRVEFLITRAIPEEPVISR